MIIAVQSVKPIPVAQRPPLEDSHRYDSRCQSYAGCERQPTHRASLVEQRREKNPATLEVAGGTEVIAQDLCDAHAEWAKSLPSIQVKEQPR